MAESSGPPRIPPAATEPIAAADVLQVAKIVRGAKLSDPPNATPELDGTTPDQAPKVGNYHLVGRFPSSAATMVFLAYKASPYGFIRRAVVKWAGRRYDNFDHSRNIVMDEARAIAFLDHPNLVKILDVGEDAEGAYLALEYVAGPDLRRVCTELMQQKKKMPVDLACYIAVEVLRGLEHAHLAVGPDNQQLHLIHRDVNPSNVIISNEGHVKLTDFGMVHMRGRMQEPTGRHIVKGKYRYMAPEYIAEQKLSLQADLYGAAIMLFEMLTGELCFPGDEPTDVMTRIVREGPPYKLLDKNGVPKDLRKILHRATDRDPGDRFEAADEMYRALEAWLKKNKSYVSPTTLADFLREEHMPVR